MVHKIICFIAIGLIAKCETNDKSLQKDVDFPNGYIGKELLKTDSLIKKVNGIIYIKNIPFSGILVDKYPNDSIKSKCQYSLGKRHGNYEGWYPDGSRWFKRLYLEGKKEGIHLTWWPDGAKKSFYPFKNGFKEGNHKDWFNDGTLFKDFNYMKGYEFGYQKMWRPDGKIRANYYIDENGRRFGLLGLKKCVTVKNSPNE